ncbi:SMP-30/gluconolactonase/LRE family protein [Nocardia sp. NPDC127579]|uniref:SMP-30/gluconolactonase/LRE family protein n=1 Tax=Nocardia sp. NPDC127579 TaxID=3345402 RepID=UPI00362CC2DF
MLHFVRKGPTAMRIRIRHFLLGVTAIVTVACTSAAPVEPSPASLDRYVIPGDRAFPTGLAYHPATGHYFVGSAADGALYRGHVDRPEVELWSPNGADGRALTSGMTLDPAGRLFVNGASSNTIRIYDSGSAALLAELRGLEGGFVNEVSIADDGSAYVTDSFLPVIYRITESDGRWHLEPWLNVADTVIDWVPGQHNLNGILAVGRHLLSVQSNTGKLWRIDRVTRAVIEVQSAPLPSADALISNDGRRVFVTQGNLYAASDQEPRVAVLAMNEDLTSARVVDSLIPPGGFRHPSQAALTDMGRILVVNSQYNRFVSGQAPELPFTISSLPVGD